MPMSEIDPDHDIDAIAEAQLQQELLSLFVIDTEHYLQKYSQIAQSLQAQSWRADIQELYRCIHTIKGGAVTVGYEAVLQVATALEDLLSHLRYLELAPLLTDSHLSQALLEAGELLTVTTEFAVTDTKPLLNRIQTLHQEIQERYLPSWNKSSQLHQEFAGQGLDLVMLELEIALEQLPTQGRVPNLTLQIAQILLEQLEQIGLELQLATGWTKLLQQGQILFSYPDNAIWRIPKEQCSRRSHWSLFFEALKTCAKQSGNPLCFDFPSFKISRDNPFLVAPEVLASEISQEALPLPDFLQQGLDQPSGIDASAEMGAFLDVINLDENASIPQLVDFLDVSPVLDTTQLTDIEQVESFANPEEVGALLAADNFADLSLDFSQVQDWLEQSSSEDFEADLLAIQEQNAAEDLQFLEPSPVVIETNQSQSQPQEIVKIPVPLEKLDQSAQQLVETILALRSTQGFYQTLQNQITQLVTLAQESVSGDY